MNPPNQDGDRMHEILRQRFLRALEALPEERLYQALDYLEFLSSKYNREGAPKPVSPLQRFGERLEDGMRRQRVGVRAIQGTMSALSVASKVVSGVVGRGRDLARGVEEVLKEPPAASRAPGLPSSPPPPSRTGPAAPEQGSG